MNGLILDPTFCALWSKVLLHSFWQGLVILGLSQLIVRAFQRSSPNARYIVLGAAQILLFLCLIVTFVVIERSGARSPSEEITVALQNFLEHRTPVSASFVPQNSIAFEHVAVGNPSVRSLSATESIIPVYAATGYFVGTALMLLRLVFGAFEGRRLVIRSAPITDSRVLKCIGKAVLAMRFSYTPAIALSRTILVPSVVGILRPTIILPITALTGLSPRELELLVMHELAHIKRYDQIANVMLRIVEAFTFYHPVSWILSRQLRYERELCCDDSVIAAGGNAAAYINALLRMVELSCDNRPTDVMLLQLAATGNISELRRRVNRLVALETVKPVRMRPVGAVLCTAATLIMLGSSLGMMLHAPRRDMRVAELRATLDQTPELVNGRTSGGLTRLHDAAGFGSIDEIAILLAHEADLHVATDEGWRPLHTAVWYNRMENVLFLVRAGARINGQNKDGKAPLHVALGMSTYTLDKEPPTDLDMVRLLCELGADVNQADTRGFTPLFGAVDRGDQAVVIELLRRGAKVNARNKNGQTPFMHAAGLANANLMSLLLSHGADPFAMDIQQRNAIDALCVRDLEAAAPDPKMLADCFALLRKRDVPISIAAAAAMGLTDELAGYLQNDPTVVNVRPSQTQRAFSLLHWAVISQNPDTCKLLLNHGADINSNAANNVTPIYLAVNRAAPNPEILNALVEFGADRDAKDKLGRTALYIATVWGHAEIANILLRAGANSRLVDNDFRTPLHLLCEKTWNAIVGEQVRALLKSGADLNAADRDGRTPLHYGVSRGQMELVELLLNLGADPNARDSEGRNPYELAMSQGGQFNEKLLKRLRPIE